MAVGILLLVIIISVVLLTNSSDENTPTPTTNSSVILQGNHKVFEKEIWGGRQVSYKRPMRHPAKFIIISHTAGNTCMNFKECAAIMQQIQAQHVGTNKLSDVGYNFVIGHDGNVYVGRGWDLRNMHTDDSIGICYMGNYVFDKLSSGMIEATQELINYGIRLKKVSPDYTVVAHNQTYPTDSPGQNVYVVIKTWKHFNPNYIGT